MTMFIRDAENMRRHFALKTACLEKVSDRSFDLIVGL